MAGVQQFNLRWNNHTNNILQVFLEQLSNENLVDVTLSCQGQFLKAHKMILSACSPYFQELFKQHQVQHPVIIMNGMKFVDVKLVVEFMYRGEIKVLETELAGLLAVAETLQVKGLSNVRNKYEKGEIQCADTPDQHEEQQLQQQPLVESSEQGDKTENGARGSTPLHLRRKRRKISASPSKEDSLVNNTALTGTVLQTRASPNTNAIEKSPVTTKQSLSCVQVSMNDYMNDDDDLPTTIKVEPPDIRDIDEEEPTGWESPKLVIDLPESQEQQPKLNSIPPKSPTRANKTVKVGSPSMFGKSRFMVNFQQLGEASAGSSKDMLLPQLLSPREKKQNAWHKRRAGKIPRPPNAFMIFANEWRRKLAFQHPTESNKEISVRLGAMWKNLSADTKEGYYTASRQADEEHKRKYPGYYYSPKEARMNKMHKHNLALARKGSKPVDALHLVKVFMGDMNETSPYLLMPEQDQLPKELHRKRMLKLEKQQTITQNDKEANDGEEIAVLENNDESPNSNKMDSSALPKSENSTSRVNESATSSSANPLQSTKTPGVQK